MPLGWLRAMIQSTARRMFLEYLPSRRVLPSIRKLKPLSAVMAKEKSPDGTCQWPSANCCRASHSKPRLTQALYSGGTSSACRGACPDISKTQPQSPAATMDACLTNDLLKVLDESLPGENAWRYPQNESLLQTVKH